MIPRRRQLLQTTVGLLATGLLPAAWGALRLPTARQTAGPFYPDPLPAETDADLMQRAGLPAAEGEAVALSGQVLEVSGRPLAGARIELWQCDARGRYHHPLDAAAGERDGRFQGYGQTVCDEQGRYAFRALKPVPYPGRTPHIHLQVQTAEGLRLTTQLYVAGDPQNALDGLFRRLSAEQARTVQAEFLAQAEPATPWAARFDLVLPR
ncbi:MAG TPA: protocatechuate 3,4-dioxygenase [Nevskiaceae bacterium]|nr:protocatechuate 3,4-dioxygenase [Nevskiaceae bacterium]